MSDRTEAPTAHRREEARRKGQVAKSIEINSAAILLVSFWLLRVMGSDLIGPLGTLMRRSFTALGTFPRIGEGQAMSEITLNTLRTGSLMIGSTIVTVIAPLVLSIMAVGIVANLGQVGFFFSQEALKPDISRISPLNGFKRVFSGRGVFDLLKSLLKIVVIGFVIYTALRDNYPALVSISQMSLITAISSLAQIGLAVGFKVGMVMVVLAAIDYIFQRRQFEKSLRMTKQEVIEEMKRYENPQLKSRIRSRQRQLAMSRMMAAVPKADVVITNPTHLAIALCYQHGEMRAPQVVAKGERLVAERIKEKARECKVPLVENKPLARSLFKLVEVGQEVPLELYQAVAEVLAFVYRIKNESKLRLQRR